MVAHVQYPFGEDPIATYRFRYRSLGEFITNNIIDACVARISPLTDPR
jgi:hypothetical protein